MKFFLCTILLALSLVALKAGDYPVKAPGESWDVSQSTDKADSFLAVNEDAPVSDYSIYGWTQVAEQNQLTKHSWIFFFRLTQLEDGSVGNVGGSSRTLACWWSSDNRLHFTGYSGGNGNLYDYLEAIPVADLVAGPFFTYYGYSSAEQSVFAYVKTSNGNVYSKKKGGYSQNPTSYLGAYVGVDYNNVGTYPALDGTYQDWYVSGGPDSWVGSEDDMEDFIANVGSSGQEEEEVEEVESQDDYPVGNPGEVYQVTQSTDNSETSIKIDAGEPQSDYSVYGWYQAAEQNQLTKVSWVFFFRLTINEQGNNLANLAKPGDRTLACWWSSDNRLHFTGYSTGNNNLYDYLEAIPVEDLVAGPFFTYYGYNAAEQSVFAYVKTSNGNVYSKKKGGYAQNPSQKFEFYLGVDYNNVASYPALDGNYSNWFVSVGPDSWVGNEEDMEAFMAKFDSDCAVVYSECDFQGDSAEICDEHSKIPFETKSAKIPEGATLTLWEDSDFQGQSADFSESFNCVENIEYQLIQKSSAESKNLRTARKQFMGGLNQN